MAALVIRRLLTTIPVLLLVTFGVYGLITLVPGDPAVALAGGENATPERIVEVRHELDLDDPFLVQYGRWLSHAVRLDFGRSLVDGRGVWEEISNRLPMTLSIALMAMALGLLIGVPAGLLAGARPGSLTDRVAMFVTTLGIAIPNFWLAMLLVTVFAVHLHWLPAVGFTRLTESPWGWFRSVVLPATALGVFVAASVARHLRAALSDVMQAPYVRTAWAKGGNVRTVVCKHALKNAAIPVVTVLGLQVSALIGGAVIIEQIFSIPGLGSYLLGGTLALDLPVIQGVTIVLVLVHMVMSLLVDIAYGLLNPKVHVT